MQNHKIRKVTAIDLVHASILHDQLNSLIGSLFVGQIGRSVLFYDYPVETTMDKIRNKEIEKCIVNAMAIEDLVTEEDIKFMKGSE